MPDPDGVRVEHEFVWLPLRRSESLQLEAGKKSRHRHPLSAFPPGQGGRVDTQLAGKFFLGDAKYLAVTDDLLCQSVAFLERVESEKFRDLGHVIDPGGRVSVLPIHNRHLVATDNFGRVDLPELEFEAPLADILAQGLWSGRVALFLCRVRSPWTTHPT